MKSTEQNLATQKHGLCSKEEHDRFSENAEKIKSGIWRHCAAARRYTDWLKRRGEDPWRIVERMAVKSRFWERHSWELTEQSGRLMDNLNQELEKQIIAGALKGAHLAIQGAQAKAARMAAEPKRRLKGEALALYQDMGGSKNAAALKIFELLKQSSHWKPGLLTDTNGPATVRKWLQAPK